MAKREPWRVPGTRTVREGHETRADIGEHEEMNRRAEAVSEKTAGWSKERKLEFKRRVNAFLSGPTSMTAAQAMEKAYASMTTGAGQVYMGRMVK